MRLNGTLTQRCHGDYNCINNKNNSQWNYSFVCFNQISYRFSTCNNVYPINIIPLIKGNYNELN